MTERIIDKITQDLNEKYGPEDIEDWMGFDLTDIINGLKNCIHDLECYGNPEVIHVKYRLEGYWKQLRSISRNNQ